MNEEKDNAENPLAMTLSKASGDESFPVLKAFQDFIDQERERARRRVVTLSVCFISAIVVLVLLFGIIFAMFFGHMMRSNEDQQNRLYDLYARSGLIPAAQPVPAPAAPAATTPIPASAAPVAPDDQVRNLMERIRLLEAGRAPAPDLPAPAAPVAPAPAASAEPASVPAMPEAAPAPVVKLPKGVRSSPRKADQEAKLAAEAKARRERAAAREAEAAAKAEAVRQAREAKAAEEAAAREAEAKAAEAAKAQGPRAISVRKQRRMVVPEGCSTDEIVVQTESGARVPLRTLLPVEGASLE